MASVPRLLGPANQPQELHTDGHSHLYKRTQGAAHPPVYHAEQTEMMLCLVLSCVFPLPPLGKQKHFCDQVVGTDLTWKLSQQVEDEEITLQSTDLASWAAQVHESSNSSAQPSSGTDCTAYFGSSSELVWVELIVKPYPEVPGLGVFEQQPT